MNDAKKATSARIFVLDTNVLMHDPAAIFRFEEHDVHIPMTVLEELDANKKGMSEAARNARQFSRFMDELISGATKAEIDAGIPLNPNHNQNGNGLGNGHGRLFFETEANGKHLPLNLPGNLPDNTLLATASSLQEQNESTKVTLVSKDINLRIKATILGISAEDYYNDKVLDDTSLLFTGTDQLDADFWDTHSKDMDSWQESGRTFYKVSGPSVAHWHPNELIYTQNDELEARVAELKEESAIIELVTDYRADKNKVWGITARNREQNFALNLLNNPDVDFVSIVGAAGTGKTLLALASGLMQTLDADRYREIIMTRVTIPLGEDIGFLPGTEEEKMEPWMGALMDNLEVLTQSTEGGDWGRAATNDLLRNRIKIRSLNFMRGRTFLDRFIIVDEAQNLTSKQMKALITRAGPGTKMICIGNVAQIDTPYLTESTSGLTYVVHRFRSWPHSGHITLTRGERSRLADFASEAL
ncbi:MAG: PhoH family protein [Pseudomonadota bacterium]